MMFWLMIKSMNPSGNWMVLVSRRHDTVLKIRLVGSTVTKDIIIYCTA